MKKWLRKSLIILVSIFTFGTVTPSHAVWSQDQDSGKEHRGQSDAGRPLESAAVEAVFHEQDTGEEDVLSSLLVEAERQSIMKFGPKIAGVIEDEFREIILPNIEAAIEMTTAQFPEDKLAELAITEHPGGGVSEKIFHIYNRATKEDVIRFHVRRDRPPLEGYTFNFHYHTYHDSFQTHYTLGTIYWDKNTPPKWMSV